MTCEKMRNQIKFFNLNLLKMINAYVKLELI
jgi:hypothetical protein